MRKSEKTAAVSQIETLMKAVEAAEIMKSTGQITSCQELLTQMQQLVIETGDLLEHSEDDCQNLVKKLEEACEWIYQMSMQDNMNQFGRQAGQLKSLFAQIVDELQLKKTITEILFLPYQVSMWDSLESVWMAADEDESVKTYVVPIPFYDVNPDGSLGAMHYDGDKYPDYVPVTPYQKYDIQARRPDMIFIHNPYDGCNSVTRIPEEYYAVNLKKCTDMLVYIPYLVSDENGPAALQCSMPGVLFADRVIVQPGHVYEKYCREYTKALEENNWTSYFVPAEEKFLPLGSPKFDKLLTTKCELEDLPESWRKVILRPDGSRKKIIFYNLTITTLLENNEQVLRKLDNVFEIFKEMQEDVVLLWRPHPLLLNTINSMRPQLRDEYLERVQQFKEEKWGIYDETPDPNLGMAVSDAYYGDRSSLAVTYQATGKPIMIQDVDIIDEDI